MAPRNAAALTRPLHASCTTLARLLHSPYLLVALRNAAAFGKGNTLRKLSIRVPRLRRLRIPIQHTSAYARIRPHTSAYVRIRPHTSSAKRKLSIRVPRRLRLRIPIKAL